MDTDMQALFEDNREAWNKRTVVHKQSEFYDVSSFIAGKSSLNKIELEELGNVQGKSLLHLQCHFGMDTISWAREGAQVTGMDISDESIQYAKHLSRELDISSEFICCNLYDLGLFCHRQFDIVFTSYGVIGWLPDLDKWASVIAHFLKPGGTFYMVEFHPVAWMMDENFDYIKYHYHNAETISDVSTGTYADRYAAIEYTEHSWNHSLGEVINSLIKHNLQVSFLNEYPFSCYNCFNNLIQGEDRYWRVKGLGEKIPLMYSIKCIRDQ